MSMFPPRRPAQPFGMNRTPFDPLTGKHFTFGENDALAVMTVVAEGYDVILCTDRDDNRVLVAKPRPLRKSTFDGVVDEVDLRSYVSRRLGRRNVNYLGFGVDSPEPWYSEEHELYVAGEKILALRLHERDQVTAAYTAGEIEGVDQIDERLLWEDANLAGRRWDSGEVAYLTIDTGGEGVEDIECRDEDGVLVYVAKPFRLRPRNYDGLTIGGVTYTSTGNSTRTASNGVDPDEDQTITPSYIDGQTIRVVRSTYVDADNGFPFRWEDGSVREWAVEA